MPQVHGFTDGGFVVHKLTGSWSGHVSAWFSRTGRLIDVEHVTRSGQRRGVSHIGPMWSEVAARGRVYEPR